MKHIDLEATYTGINYNDYIFEESLRKLEENNKEDYDLIFEESLRKLE